MDLELSQFQQMLRDGARQFLASACPPSLVRAMERDPRGYTDDLWRQIAGQGWLGLSLPESLGGSGGNFLDLLVLLEEAGRALLPGPFFSTALGALTLLDAGSDKQRQRLLPAMARGQAFVTLAVAEAAGSYRPEDIQTTAKSIGDSYVLQGTKLFVTDAHVADYLLVAARTAEGSRPEEGLGLFLVPSSAQGVEVRPMNSVGGDRPCEVSMKAVRVPLSALLGQEGQGWRAVERAVQRAAVARCAQMLGAAQRVLEMSLDYVKQRTQFGRPVGSFQAVQHHCANMAIDVEGCRYITYQAGWAVSEGLSAAAEVASAKAWVSEACQRVCALAHQCHGAVGFTQEHDLQLYTRRIAAWAASFGDASYHRERLAQVLWG